MSDVKVKKVERIFCIVTAIIALSLIVAAFFSYIFIPAACIMSALTLFGLWYMNKDDKDSKVFSIIYFIIGVGLLIFAVTYTIMKTS